MISDVVPHIEVINENQIKEAGLKYKMEKEAIMRKIQGMNYKKGEEPTEADDLLLEEKMANR